MKLAQGTGSFFWIKWVEDQGHGCDFVLRHCLWCAWRCSKVYGRGDRFDRWFIDFMAQPEEITRTISQFPSKISFQVGYFEGQYSLPYLMIVFWGSWKLQILQVQPLQQQLSHSFGHLSPKVGMIIKFPPKSSSSLVHYSAWSPKKILYPANWI